MSKDRDRTPSGRSDDGSKGSGAVRTGPGGRGYEIAVCSLCGSDNIFSTEHDSWCDDCREWMSADVAVVVPAERLKEAVALLDDLADALADVSHGVVPRDGSVVRDVLGRAARHANGTQAEDRFEGAERVLRRALEEACGDAWTDGERAVEQYLERASAHFGLGKT